MSRATDTIVVGAGLVGLATARELALRGHRVVVLDKEPAVAVHQSGRNSGVLHAGVYYPPGSHKARLCAEGRTRLLALCEQRSVAHRITGKLVVATRTDEVDRLDALGTRARANGLEVTRLDAAGIAEREPHVRGVAALWVPATGIVDFSRVAEVLADDIRRAGGELRLRCAVERFDEGPGRVLVHTDDGTCEASRAVNCAGLHSDRLARASGLDPRVRIVGFRGEYWQLDARADHLVRGLVYPVPDPGLPFLGVHLTRGIDGSVHVGPNAVLALGREAYTWHGSQPRSLLTLVVDPAVRRMGRRWWRAGAAELVRSASPALVLRAARRLVPELRRGDLRRAPAGVRAQAVDDDGRLLDDFAFLDTARTVHVLNAPSPAATACLAIGAQIADRLDLR